MVPYQFHIIIQPSHTISTYGPDMAQAFQYHSHTFVLVRAHTILIFSMMWNIPGFATVNWNFVRGNFLGISSVDIIHEAHVITLILEARNYYWRGRTEILNHKLSRWNIQCRNRRHILNKSGKTHLAEPTNSNPLQDVQIVSPNPANPFEETC